MKTKLQLTRLLRMMCEEADQRYTSTVYRSNCTCGRSFSSYERMADGRCEICHELDPEITLEEDNPIMNGGRVYV